MNKRRNSKTTTFSDTPIIHTCDESPTKNGVLSKFSEGLSPEGRLAMELAMAESKEAKRKVSFDVPVMLPNPGETPSPESSVPSKEKPQANDAFSKTSSSSDSGSPAEPPLPNGNPTSPPSILQNSRQKSFIDAYERTSSFRLEDDITSSDYKSRLSRTKRALDGGRFGSAMETVEIVKHGEVTREEEGVGNGGENGEDTTQRNAVEKCLVWMEVTGLSQDNDLHS